MTILARAHRSLSRLYLVVEKVLINVEVLALAIPELSGISLNEDSTFRISFVKGKNICCSETFSVCKGPSQERYFTEIEEPLSIITTLYSNGKGKYQEKAGALHIELAESQQSKTVTGSLIFKAIGEAILHLHSLPYDTPHNDLNTKMVKLPLDGLVIGGYVEVMLSFKTLQTTPPMGRSASTLTFSSRRAASTKHRAPSFASSLASGDETADFPTGNPNDLSISSISQVSELESFVDPTSDLKTESSKPNPSTSAQKLIILQNLIPLRTRVLDSLELQRSLNESKQECVHLSTEVALQEEKIRELTEVISEQKTNIAAAEQRALIADDRLKRVVVGSAVRLWRNKQVAGELSDERRVPVQGSKSTFPESGGVSEDAEEKVEVVEVGTERQDSKCSSVSLVPFGGLLDPTSSGTSSSNTTSSGSVLKRTTSAPRYLWNQDLMTERDNLERKSTQQARMLEDQAQQIKALKEEIGRLTATESDSLVKTGVHGRDTKTPLVRDARSGDQVSLLVRHLDIAEMDANQRAARITELEAALGKALEIQQSKALQVEDLERKLSTMEADLRVEFELEKRNLSDAVAESQAVGTSLKQANSKLSEKLEKQTKTITDLKAEVKALQESNEQIITKSISDFESLRKELGEERSRSLTGIDEARVTIDTLRNQYEQEKLRLLADLEGTKEDCKQLRLSVTGLETENHSLIQKSKELQVRGEELLERHQHELLTLSSEREMLIKQYDALLNEFVASKDTNSKLTNDVSVLVAQIAEIKVVSDKLSEEITVKSERESELNRQVDDLKAVNTEVERNLSELKTRNDSLLAEREDLAKRVEKQRSRIQELKEKALKAASELQQYQKDKEEKKEIIHKYEIENSRLSVTLSATKTELSQLREDVGRGKVVVGARQTHIDDTVSVTPDLEGLIGEDRLKRELELSLASKSNLQVENENLKLRVDTLTDLLSHVVLEARALGGDVLEESGLS